MTWLMGSRFPFMLPNQLWSVWAWTQDLLGLLWLISACIYICMSIHTVPVFSTLAGFIILFLFGCWPTMWAYSTQRLSQPFACLLGSVCIQVWDTLSGVYRQVRHSGSSVCCTVWPWGQQNAGKRGFCVPGVNIETNGGVLQENTEENKVS